MENLESLFSSYTGNDVGCWRYGNEEHRLFWFSDPAPVVIRLAGPEVEFFQPFFEVRLKQDRQGG